MRRAWLPLGLSAVAAVSLGAAFLAASPRGAALAQLAMHLAAGREAAIPLGLVGGLPWPTSFLLATLLEWTMLLAVVPLAGLASARLHRWRPVRDAILRAESYAARRPDAGVLFLGAVTLTPFLPIGAITSLFVGVVLGLPKRRLVPVLMLAELAANLYVALAAASLVALFPEPWMGGAFLAAVALALGLAFGLRRRNESVM